LGNCQRMRPEVEMLGQSGDFHAFPYGAGYLRRASSYRPGGSKNDDAAGSHDTPMTSLR
jgi:hypothetical protein